MIMAYSKIARDVNAVMDAMFLYLALTDEGLVKVGISRTPKKRLVCINCGSPFEIRAAQWVWIGRRSVCIRLERLIKRKWAARNTRGEWFRFDYSNPEDKAEFNSIGELIQGVTGVKPKWTKLTPEQVKTIFEENSRRVFGGG